jgi:hypothetical protein
MFGTSFVDRACTPVVVGAAIFVLFANGAHTQEMEPRSCAAICLVKYVGQSSGIADDECRLPVLRGGGLLWGSRRYEEGRWKRLS